MNVFIQTIALVSKKSINTTKITKDTQQVRIFSTMCPKLGKRPKPKLVLAIFYLVYLWRALVHTPKCYSLNQGPIVSSYGPRSQALHHSFGSDLLLHQTSEPCFKKETAKKYVVVRGFCIWKFDPQIKKWKFDGIVQPTYGCSKKGNRQVRWWKPIKKFSRKCY